MLYTPVVPRGRCKKLTSPWSGPYKILKKLSEVTYRIRCCHGGRKRIVVHFNRLKLCPANVRGSSYCPQNSSHSSQGGDATSSPVNTEISGSGDQVVLIPDDDERVVNSPVLAAEGASTPENTSITGSTSTTGTTESAPATESASTTMSMSTTESTAAAATTEDTSITESISRGVGSCS